MTKIVSAGRDAGPQLVWWSGAEGGQPHGARPDGTDSAGPRLGGKGQGVSHLVRGGLRVPRGFCVPGEVYLSARDAAPGWRTVKDEAAALLACAGDRGLPDFIARTERAGDALRSWAAALRLPPAAEDRIAEAGTQLAAPLAVRSSAWIEDRPGRSAAGLWFTALGVRGDGALLEAILRCWRGMWSPAAVQAMLHDERSSNAAGQRGDAPQPVSATAIAERLEDAYMAVVVQELVDAAVAGVAFSRAPGGSTCATAGAEGSLVVAATWGLGQPLVDGSVAGDLYCVDRRDGRIRQSRPGAKPIAVVVDGRGGVEKRVVSAARVQKPCLAAAQLQKIRTLVLDVETAWPMPQPVLDVEWAIDHAGRLFALQAREARSPAAAASPRVGARAADRAGSAPGRAPLLPLQWQRPDLAWTRWRMEAVHKAPHVRSPLRQSLLDPIMQQAQLVAVGGDATVPLQRLYRRGYGLPRLLYLGGHAFRGSAVDEMPPGVTAPAPSPAVQRLLHSLIAASSDDRWRTWRTEVQPRLRTAGAALFAQPWERGAAAVVRRAYVRFLQFLREQWLLHFVLEDRALRRLRSFCSRWNVLDEEGCVQLVFGRETHVTRLAAELRRLGGMVAASPALTRDFAAQAEAGWPCPHLLSRHAAFRGRFAELIARYGHQLAGGDDLLSPAWNEDPRTALQGVHGWAQILRNGAPATGGAEAVAEQLAADVRSRLRMEGAGEQALAKFERLRFEARRSRTYLDDHNLLLDQASFSLIRHVHLGLGRRFRRQRLLERAADTMFCYLDEILGLLEIAPTPRPSPGVIAWRRTYHEQWSRRPVARDVGQAQVPVVPPADADRLLGTAASGGRCTGTARVATSGQLPRAVRAGDVLVCSLLLPSWSWILPLVGAVVADGGNALSHGAIMVREAGIPAVFSTGSGTRLIPEGSEVAVDGDTGVVTFVAPDRRPGDDAPGSPADRAVRPFPSEWQEPADRFRRWRLWHDPDRGPDTPLAAGLLALAVAPVDRVRCRVFDGFWYLTGTGGAPVVREPAPGLLAPTVDPAQRLKVAWRNLGDEGEDSHSNPAPNMWEPHSGMPSPDRMPALGGALGDFACASVDALSAMEAIVDAAAGWFLTPPEVAALCFAYGNRRDSVPDLGELIAARRAEYRSMRGTNPPTEIAAVPEVSVS